MFLALANYKDFTDFLERFLINAVTPVILILLLVYLVKCQKPKLSQIRPIAYLLIFYVSIDLLFRLYYTFILGMENQTRYFMIQTLFYLIPAAFAWEYLSESKRITKAKFYLISCSIIFLFGSITSLRPKWNKPEYEKFTEIIRKHPAKYKFVVELKKNKQDQIKSEYAFELSYYSGIYRNRNEEKYLGGKDGQIFYFSKEYLEEINGQELKLLSDLEDDGDKKYLYVPKE